MPLKKRSVNERWKKENDDSQLTDKIELEILLEASPGSARRINTILVIMVIASVLAFSAYWNSLPNRWSAKRITIISKVSYNLERLQSDFKDSLLRAIKEKTEPGSNQNSGGGKTLESLKIQDFRKYGALKEKFLITDFIKQQKLDNLEESKIKEIIKEISFRRFEIEEFTEKGGIMKFDIFIGEEKVETLRVELKEGDGNLIAAYERLLISGTKELRNYYMKSIENRNQGYLNFNIPYLNIHFDINDLGFIGGLAFVLILGALYLNLIKEKENIEIAFDTSRTVFKTNYVKRRNFIRFMSLNQFICMTSKDHVFITTIARSIFLYMPVAVSLLIFMSDLATIQVSKILDPDGYFFWDTMVSKICSVLCIFILTIFCHKRTKDIDKIWKAEVDEVNKLEKPES